MPPLGKCGSDTTEHHDLLPMHCQKRVYFYFGKVCVRETDRQGEKEKESALERREDGHDQVLSLYPTGRTLE